LVENNDPEFGLESGEEVQEGDPELKNDSRYSLDGEQFEQEEAVE
jgi:hypothetical protein